MCDRSALLARWFDLTRRVLPGMAAVQRWPIRADHCFMRVCLDCALDQAWPRMLRAPAYRHASDAQLARAVDVAESIVARPQSLPALNLRSLAMRAAWRAEGTPKMR